MQIGRYTVVRELATGGMARVILCTSPQGRDVVVKRPLQDNPEWYDRLLDEAQSGARLDHPNIVETLDFFTEDGVPHLVVSYVPGRSILELRNDGPLDPAVVVRIGRQIADALHAMHTVTDGRGEPLGMVHRDISPSNILLGYDGQAKLIDLGIVRSAETISQRTKTGFLRGKVAYLAPELFFGRPYSPASDLWALGLVLFEAAVGRRAIRGGQPEMIAQIVGGHVMELDEGEQLDPALEGALLRLLHPNPESRVRRASEAAALFRMLERQLPRDADERSQAAARGTTSILTPAVLGTLVDDRLVEGEPQEDGSVGLTAAATAIPEEPEFNLRAARLDETVRARPRPAPVMVPTAAVERGRVFDLDQAPSDEIDSFDHSGPTSLLAEWAGGTAVLPLPESEDGELSPADRLRHYVEELKELSNPRSFGPAGMPGPFDPWSMDSSPGV